MNFKDPEWSRFVDGKSWISPQNIFFERHLYTIWRSASDHLGSKWPNEAGREPLLIEAFFMRESLRECAENLKELAKGDKVHHLFAMRPWSRYRNASLCPNPAAIPLGRCLQDLSNAWPIGFTVARSQGASWPSDGKIYRAETKGTMV